MAEMKNGLPYKKITGRQKKLAKGYQPKLVNITSSERCYFFQSIQKFS